MPFPRQYVDALLVNWGDRLFHDPLRHVRAPHLPGVALPRDARRLRERLALTLRRAPEVMVKITTKHQAHRAWVRCVDTCNIFHAMAMSSWKTRTRAC